MNEDIMYNKEKFKDMIHYIIYRCQKKPNFGRTILYKLLYFSDFNFYELYEKPLSGEIYVHKPRGPIPKDFLKAKDELIQEKRIKEEVVLVIDYNKYVYESLKDPLISNFSDDEIEVLENNILTLGDMSSSEISKYSHGDLPWEISDDDEDLIYESVFYRDPEYSVRDYGEEQ